ncbi:helix-turn-helix domain-containing protein [[Kitasatospora] papulosa]|uniref:helix-turn-helix domain-containing protein n=1 Tax=[Kitasatospora] papulosa TaxID=1464011 RepID=UPI0036C45DD2
MSRPSIDSRAKRPFAHLAEHLVALRDAARLPQRALATLANISRNTVQSAESGITAPSTGVLDAYLIACGADQAAQARAHLLRARGRTAQRDKLRGLKAPAPAFLHDKHDLALALAAVYERAGAPSLSDSRLTPGRTPLPRTTAWRIVERKGLPATTTQLVTFLTACGVSPAEQRLYIDAYQRITADRGARPAPPRPRRSTDIRVITEARSERHEVTGLAAAIARQLPAEQLEDLLFTAITREAHRNGSALPDLWFTSDSPQDTGIDAVAHTRDGKMVLIQAKSYRRPSGTPFPQPRVPSAPPNRPGTAVSHPEVRREALLDQQRGELLV